MMRKFDYLNAYIFQQQLHKNNLILVTLWKWSETILSRKSNILYFSTKYAIWHEYQMYGCYLMWRVIVNITVHFYSFSMVFKLQSHLHPGRAPRRPGWSGNDRGTTGNNRSTSVTLPARPGWSGNIRHSTPDGIKYLISPGWSGMTREGIALPDSSLGLPGTTGLYRGSTVALPAQTGDDPGYDLAGRATVEPWRIKVELRLIPVEPRQSPNHFKRITTVCDDCTCLYWITILEQ
jgi:hypothetical protein